MTHEKPRVQFIFNSVVSEYFSLKVNKEARIKVEVSSDFDLIRYVVIGRTGILEMKNRSIPVGVNTFEIKFMATSLMIPEFQVLVYHIQFSGEVIHDHLTLHFDEILTNNVRNC